MIPAIFEFLAITQAGVAAAVVQRAHSADLDDAPELATVALAVLAFGGVFLMLGKVAA